MSVFILTDFQEWCCDVSFLTSICANNTLRLRKLNFLNKLISQTFSLLSLLNAKQSTGFLSFHDTFCVSFSRVGLRPLEYILQVIFHKFFLFLSVNVITYNVICKEKKISQSAKRPRHEFRAKVLRRTCK